MQDETLPAPEPGQAVLRTLYTGVSRGTERLVLRGEVPESEYGRMRAPFQVGDFPFPVNHGYALVGEAVAGPDALIGKICFALAPHADHAVVPAEACLPLPPGLPPRRAVLGANAETALNAVWDSGAGPADRIAVVGAGLVGALTGAIAAGLPGAQVTLVDTDPSRAALAEALGCAFASPETAPGEADIVFHASASQAGLDTALALAGFEADIVEMSWYGTRPVTVAFGGAFHSRRLRLVSSQVGAVAPSRRARTGLRRRLEAALGLLREPRFAALLGDDFAFSELESALPRILEDGAGGPCPVIRYDYPPA